MPSETSAGDPEEKGEESSTSAEETHQEIKEVQQLQNRAKERGFVNPVHTGPVPLGRPQKRARADTSGQSVDVSNTPSSLSQVHLQEDGTAKKEHQSSQECLPTYEVKTVTRCIEYKRADGSTAEKIIDIPVEQLSACGEGSVSI